MKTHSIFRMNCPWNGLVCGADGAGCLLRAGCGNNRHTKLYLKLADAAQRLQQFTNKEAQRQQRAHNLRSIQTEMATELAD